MSKALPIDAAQLCLWRGGQGSPTVFVVEEKEATKVLTAFMEEEGTLEFQSYPDGSGRRSTTVVRTHTLDAITVERASLQLATRSIIPHA